MTTLKTPEEVSKKMCTPLIMDMSWINTPNYGERLQTVTSNAITQDRQATAQVLCELLEGATTTSVIEHTHSFAKFDGMTDEELEKELANGEKFFQKK